MMRLNFDSSARNMGKLGFTKGKLGFTKGEPFQKCPVIVFTSERKVFYDDCEQQFIFDISFKFIDDDYDVDSNDDRDDYDDVDINDDRNDHR